MAKEKRSFFGKIMGGDEPAQQVNVSTEQYVQPLQTVTEVEEEQVLAEVDDVEDMEVETPVQASAEEEWMSDYEGTLNIDLYQTRDNVIIKSTIAGVKSEILYINIENVLVTIKGVRVID